MLAAIVLGCGGGGSSSATTQQEAVARTRAFSAPIVGGGELDARSLAGRPVAFWFWAPT